MSHDVLRFEDLETADIRRGAICQGGSKGTIRDEPIHKLLKVGNQGGIRLRGAENAPVLVALFSTQEHPDWPDEIDGRTGVVRYHGDNRTSVVGLHEPKGNRLLRQIFARGFSSTKDRQLTPPFFVFTSPTEAGHPARSQRFQGLAVPGTPTEHPEDWIVAKWFDRPGGRFENYLLTLQLLDVPVVRRAWIDELATGDVLGPSCPDAYRKWVEHGHV